ncbi:MAG: ATP-binding cassette domain-containing protein, partial [Thermodesulfobacteriota bacterium]|nr:ATP-binding cassette domain-containing protein [Thermodesulfobacteriota bacterium]
MSTSPSLLRINGLTKIFVDNGIRKVIFQDVNIDLQTHDSIAIVGPSGCGKTTLLLVIAGLLHATGGSVFLEGEPTSEQAHDVAVVLQEYGLFPWKTAMENIILGAKMRKIKVPQETLLNLIQ